MAWNSKRPNDPEYDLVRRKVLKRDRYQCQLCNKRGKLQVHHIIPWADSPSLRKSEFNLITLCIGCHKKVTKNEHNYMVMLTHIVNSKYK